MSTRHFVDAARYIRRLQDTGYFSEARKCYVMICFINDNPNFNKDVFRIACDFDEEDYDLLDEEVNRANY